MGLYARFLKAARDDEKFQAALAMIAVDHPVHLVIFGRLFDRMYVGRQWICGYSPVKQILSALCGVLACAFFAWQAFIDGPHVWQWFVFMGLLCVTSIGAAGVSIKVMRARLRERDFARGVLRKAFDYLDKEQVAQVERALASFSM
ncbi:MAG: hypothetical protein ABIH41_07250 [Nanoarchaeota archaeon]